MEPNVFDLENTAYFKVAEKVFPGLVEAAVENGIDLVDITITGAAPARIMGIASSSPGWLDSGNLVDIVASNTEGWAGHVLGFKPLTLRKVSDRFMLSTAVSDSPVGNNKRSIVDADLNALGIRFGGDYFSVLNEVFGAGVSANLNVKAPAVGSPETWPTNFVNSSQSDGHMIGFKCELDEFGYSTLSSLVANMGYQIDKTSPLLKATRKPPSGNPNPEKRPMDWASAEKVGRLEAGFAFTHADCIRNMVRFGCWSSKPGMKYIPFIFNWLNPTSSSDITVFHVPVVDDGNSKFLVLINCETSGSQFAIAGNDVRYGGAREGITIEHKDYMISRHTGFTGITTPLGAEYELSRIPSDNHGQAISSLGDNILAFLMPPISDQHFFASRLSHVVSEFTLNGKQGRMHQVSMTSSFYACKLPKDWYSTYYKTGFGLFKPRASNIQTNILTAWNKLDFQDFSICVDGAYSTINPEIVDTLPIAQEYKKMREKACKDDDWLSQPYADGITYGAIKTRIQNKPRLSAFYSVSGVSGDYVMPPLVQGDFSWKREVSELDSSVTYVRTEGEESEVYAINEVTRDLILSEWAEASSVTINIDAFGVDFGLTEGDKTELKEGIEVAKNPYWRDINPLKGYILKEQYYAPESGLSMSGYPVYRYMHSPFREQMVLRCYADLNAIGEPLTRIVQSFTSDAIISKILSK